MASLKSYILRRAALIPVSIFVLTSVIFVLIRVLPGAGPVEILNLKLPPEMVARINKDLGLDKSLFDQYLIYMSNIFLKFDFGFSYSTSTPIIDELVPRFMATLELSILASLIGVPLGIYIGTFSGKNRGNYKDNISRIYTIAVYSIPIFWLGIWMQVIFTKIFRKFQGQAFGWIPANLRTSSDVIPYIHNVTGIYFVDTLFFSGPPGWELIYYVFGVILFVTLLIGYIYKMNERGYKIEQSKLYSLVVAFVIYEISIMIIFSDIITQIGNLFTNIPLLHDLTDLIFFQYVIFIQAFFAILALLAWFLYYNDFSPELKPLIKKIFLFGFLLCLLPLIPYFLDSWFTVKQSTATTSTYSALTLFQDVMQHLILPSITLGLLISGVVARLVRTNMVTVMYEQFIDSSKARGISERKITYEYGLKNATVPAIPLIGLQFAILLGGAILTETTFSYFGLGLYLYRALTRKDYPAIQGSIILFSVCVAIVSFLSDIIYASMDKRVRL